MITGSISWDGDLIALVRVLDANGHVHRFEVVVDTGFGGALSLLPNQIRDLGLLASLPVDMVLATGSNVRVNSYEGTVLWRGERRPIRILEAEGTPLIGINLMWDSLLTAEITENGAVTIGPLPEEPESLR